jgi:LPS sulfotransferase NodH
MFDGLLKHNGYTKFVVITRPRTGSNLLINGLRTHPEMQVFGELFRGGVSEAVKGSVRQSASTFFEESVFKHYPKSIKSVGFKIFYHHPVWDEAGGVWRHLCQMDDLRVIHLRRANLLRNFVSMKIAQKTDIWKESGETANPASDKRVEISAEECIAFFDRATAQEQETDEKFVARPLMRISYEELANGYDEVMRGVQAFLGVRQINLASMTRKQNPEALRHLILNYEEIMRSLTGTRWEAFLADA